MATTVDKRPVSIRYTGPELLSTPVLNKGTAFSKREREEFNLVGLLPHRFETIESQVERAYKQYQSFDEAINKHIFLRGIQDKNETLFYRLVGQHIEEMMPIIYTPVVGEACERFSEIYRQHRGLFISYEDRDHIDTILANVTKPNIKVIVVTDGSRILGLGDQGAGGMGIPIGKLSLYTACGGISPAYTLPITLDVGTNNQSLLDDPLYIGAKHKRIEQAEYDAFIDLFIQAVKQRWPNVLLQFEDFEQKQAQPLLDKYRDQLCCFNDDIQGTASVTAGTLLAACKVKNEQLKAQRIVFVGAGSAGCGIAEQLVAHMVEEGLSEQQARSQIYMVGRNGLITEAAVDLNPSQQRLIHYSESLENWQTEAKQPSLEEVVRFAKPTVLIGVSGQPGLFTQTLIETMQQGCDRPIVFPLSNPSKRIEASPQQLIEWTNGKAIIATGSPFEPITYNGIEYLIAQCNNSYIFPGIGLAVVAANISRITDELLMVASEILAAKSPLATAGTGALLPPLVNIVDVSMSIAFAVAKKAEQQGYADKMQDDVLQSKLEHIFWQPEYRQYVAATKAET
jgi:malate dehydrogenase (oxaloacetate-decarboxylating)